MTTTTPGASRPRRRWLWLGMAVAFVLTPLIEIAAILQVGQVIGPWWTIALLVFDSLIGAWLIRREGGKAWQALSTALASGRMPSRELADGALILIGGTLMLTPGFVTDALGILLVLPLTRPVARQVMTRIISRRLAVVSAAAGSAAGAWTNGQRPGPGGKNPVVRGEVIDDGEVS